MSQEVLILGATGKTGIPVVEEALKAGLEVRAAIRREDDRSAKLRALGAETVHGDVHDLQSLRELTEGMDGVYLSYPTHLDRLVEVTGNLAIAARDSGVSRVVNMSQITSREDARSPLSRQHWLSERILDLAEVGAVHIRPTYFLENLLLFAGQSIAEDGKIYLPYGDRKHAPVAPRDIARTVVYLLRNPNRHVGECLELTGPELLDVQEMGDVIGQELGRPIEYVDLPADVWHSILTERLGFPEFLAHHLHKVAIDHQEGLFEKRTDTVERLTGIAPQTLRDYVTQHHAQFEGRETIFMGV